MIDNRSDKVKAICKAYKAGVDCRFQCPLRDACKMKAGDTKEIYDARMNKVAETLNEN